jgi:hypothetical protein
VTPISVLFYAVSPRELVHSVNAQARSAPSEGRDEGVNPIEAITRGEGGQLRLSPAPQVAADLRLHLDELEAFALD